MRERERERERERGLDKNLFGDQNRGETNEMRVANTQKPQHPLAVCLPGIPCTDMLTGSVKSRAFSRTGVTCSYARSARE